MSEGVLRSAIQDQWYCSPTTQPTPTVQCTALLHNGACTVYPPRSSPAPEAPDPFRLLQQCLTDINVTVQYQRYSTSKAPSQDTQSPSQFIRIRNRTTSPTTVTLPASHLFPPQHSTKGTVPLATVPTVPYQRYTTATSPPLHLSKAMVANAAPLCCIHMYTCTVLQ